MGNINNIFTINDNFAPIPEPSAVLPKTELIKNAERALSGRMNIDFISDKNSIQILWDVVTETELGQLKTVFAYYRVLNINYDGKPAANYYVDALDYTPTFITDTLHYKDITVDLVEI